jgi:hypothetical protein
MPSAWSSGAPLSFQLAYDGTAWCDLFNVTLPGQAYSAFEVVAPNPPVNGTITLPPGLGAGVQYVKVRSGTRNLPVSQEAPREFQFVLEMPP